MRCAIKSPVRAFWQFRDRISQVFQAEFAMSEEQNFRYRHVFGNYLCVRGKLAPNVRLKSAYQRAGKREESLSPAACAESSPVVAVERGGVSEGAGRAKAD